jgi:hypothetical protein
LTGRFKATYVSAWFATEKCQMPGKRVQFDEKTWSAIALLASDRGVDFQTLATEAFSDLLRKHRRPTDLKSALRQSVGGTANVHPFPGRKRPARKAPRR